MVAVAVAPVPNPELSVIVTVGAVMYPEPGLVKVMDPIPPTATNPPIRTSLELAEASAWVPEGGPMVTVGILV